jgi:trimeric autotransporter adhesin
VTDFPTTFDRSVYERLCAAGMPAGMGTTESACVMAALNLACGGSLTDSAESPCVLPTAAAFAIGLNDARWSSLTARASGMHNLGLALLGTADLDGATFVKRLAEGTIRRVLPIALRAAGLTEHADRCEREGTRASAASAAAAVTVASAAAYASAAASDDSAASGADSAAYAAAYAAYAVDAADAADAAAYASTADAVDADHVLRVSAALATEILTEMRGAL